MAKTKMVMPVRTRQVELDGAWEGWQFEGRVNPPIAILDKLQSDRFHDICEALGSIILDWNFVDEEGQPLDSPPQAKEKAIKQYRANLNGDKPTLTEEKIIGIEAATQAAAALPFDLAIAVSAALSRSIATPDPN